MPRSTSDILHGHLPVVFKTPAAGPGAREAEPVTENPWRRAVGTPQPEIETDEGVVEAAIQNLDLSEIPVVRLAVQHGYEGLAAILDEALAQAQSGKGRERHASDEAFEDQPIFTINEMLGSLDGTAYQVIKKTREAVGQARRGDVQGARRNLLGTIVYAAATIGLVDRGVGTPRKG